MLDKETISYERTVLVGILNREQPNTRFVLLYDSLYNLFCDGFAIFTDNRHTHMDYRLFVLLDPLLVLPFLSGTHNTRSLSILEATD